MNEKQRQLLDAVAHNVFLAHQAAAELLKTVPKGTDAEWQIEEVLGFLNGIADDSRSEHCSGHVCRIEEEINELHFGAACVHCGQRRDQHDEGYCNLSGSGLASDREVRGLPFRARTVSP